MGCILAAIIREESVVHLDDLVFRRTSLWENSCAALEIAPVICKFFPWNDLVRKREIMRLTKRFERFGDLLKQQTVGIPG